MHTLSDKIKHKIKLLLFLPYYLTAHWRKLPDFIIIGVQKGGTSSLFSYLNQHPQLQLSRIKEVHYYDNNYQKGIRWYKSFFPLKSSGKKTGESSPYYFFHPHVPGRIQKDLPNVKLILMLRNPIERALSHYNMVKKNGKDKSATFMEALEKEAERTQEETKKLMRDPAYHSFAHQVYTYLSRGKYNEQLVNWLEYFPKNQFLFIKSEDFFQNPKRELERVYQFLEIDPIFPKNTRPRNVGSYDNIDPEILKKYEKVFFEDNMQLMQALGENFNWKRVSTE